MPMVLLTNEATMTLWAVSAVTARLLAAFESTGCVAFSGQGEDHPLDTAVESFS